MKTDSSFIEIIHRDGRASYSEQFFASDEADHFLSSLMNDVPWSQDSIKLFGRSVLQPRLTCWMGDKGAAYKYSGLLMQPKPWSEVVAQIKTRIEAKLAVSFNSALLNYYRNGRDSMGWHRDNEKELGPEPIIASVSFGAERRFDFRRYKTKDDKISLNLGHGSVLVMAGALQEYWEHSLPKTAKLNASNLGARINITFRRVIIK